MNLSHEQPPFDSFNIYEKENNLAKDFIRQVNATNPDNNAWAKLERNEIDIFYNCLIKSLKNITSWHTDSAFQKEKIKGLIEDLKNI